MWRQILCTVICGFFLKLNVIHGYVLFLDFLNVNGGALVCSCFIGNTSFGRISPQTYFVKFLIVSGKTAEHRPGPPHS